LVNIFNLLSPFLDLFRSESVFSGLRCSSVWGWTFQRTRTARTNSRPTTTSTKQKQPTNKTKTSKMKETQLSFFKKHNFLSLRNTRTTSKNKNKFWTAFYKFNVSTTSWALQMFFSCVPFKFKSKMKAFTIFQIQRSFPPLICLYVLHVLTPLFLILIQSDESQFLSGKDKLSPHNKLELKTQNLNHSTLSVELWCFIIFF